MGGTFSANKKSVEYPKLLSQLPSADGKVVVITGTTSGTGEVFARTAAEKGAEVVMLNRRSERSEKILADLKEQLGASSKISQIDCDLQDFASVKSAIDAIKAAYAKSGIDVLVNNAGIMAMADKATKDGYDIQMQTNHLSHFMLSKELFPLLETAAESKGEARIVSHSSIAANQPKALEAKYLEKKGGDLGGDSTAGGMKGPRWVRYQQTKQANIVFAQALHQKLQTKGSKVKSVRGHPGLSATNLAMPTVADGGMPKFAVGGIRMLAQSSEDGTCGILTCAFMPEVKSGEYYGCTKMGGCWGPAVNLPIDERFNNKDNMELLWSKSQEAVGEWEV